MTLGVGIGILVAFFIIFIAGIIIGVICDKKRYNGGICPDCGKKLYQFDIDSQGSRGYACDNCCYTAWIGYPVDKKHINA